MLEFVFYNHKFGFCTQGLDYQLRTNQHQCLDTQTKDKLVSSEVRPVVENAVYTKLLEWLEEHPNDAKFIINKIFCCGY